MEVNEHRHRLAGVLQQIAAMQLSGLDPSTPARPSALFETVAGVSKKQPDRRG